MRRGFARKAFKAAILASGVVGGVYLLGHSGSRPTIPPQDMTQPHTDPIQKDAARIQAVQKLDNIRARLDALAPFAREMDATRMYEQMQKEVGDAFTVIRQTSETGGIDGTHWVTHASHAKNIETPISKFLADVSLDKDRFARVVSKYPDVPALTTDMQTVRRLYQQSQGIPTIDVPKNTKNYTDQALLKPMALIMPPGANEETPAFAMLSSVAREMDRLGAPQDLGGSARTLSEMMRQPAPKDTRGSSELFHAMNIMERYLALDAEMRKNSRYNAAMTNLQPKYSVNINVTFNTTTTEIQKGCEALQTELKKRHGVQVGVCKWKTTP